MQRKNVVYIKGNHEKIIYPELERLCDCSPEECRHIIFEELAIGTLDRARRWAPSVLCRSGKRNILNFIRSLLLYLKLQVGGQNYLFVHGGLHVAVIGYYNENELFLVHMIFRCAALQTRP